MASQLWSQDTFSKGELSPYMYARASVNQYYNGMKTAQNVLCYPQGAAGKRFGTLYKNVLPAGITAYDQIFFQIFEYLNECVYQVVFYPDNILIYLEGILCDTVTTTGLDLENIQNIDYTVLGADFTVTGPGQLATPGTYFQPKKLSRTASAANIIASVASDQFTLTVAITDGQVLPVRFTTAGTLPVTDPQIKADVTYFVKNVSTAAVEVYASSEDAFSGTNKFTLTNVGTGVNNVVPLNTWTFGNVTFKNYPSYDFTGGYDTYTFTPAAVSGAAVVLTSSVAVFYPAHKDGAYIGNGGVGRITAVTAGSPSTTCTIAIEQPFDSAAAISGRLSLLTEPAWSDARGWPTKCSSFQNRALFANTESLPNGFWASAINDYSDFNDLESDDDDAISWFPSSDNINFIRFIVPYRSVTVHTNSGVFSSPLSFETAITPKNFSLQLQDSTPADKIQPRSIDNQIIVISGNDVHTLLWDGINNAYTSDIVSIMNEQVIRTPIDEAAYNDFSRAGSRYVFIINENGTLATFQTLLSQDVAGWTPNITEQSYGSSKFRSVAASTAGRAWFIVEREIATAQAPIALTANTATSLTAVASAFDTEEPTAVQFTTTGVLPVSSPQIALLTYYWVIGVDADIFKVYLNQADALADENAITFTDFGTNSNVVDWELVANFFLEELSFDAHLDCAEKYSGVATDTVTGLSRFNAQAVKMIGDGFGFSAEGNGDEVEFIAHGEAVEVEEAYIGFPIETIIETLPLSMATGSTVKTTSLTEPKHIRYVRFMFNNTIGGTINGVPIALNNFSNAALGQPPIPARGIFEMSMMAGWDDFNNPSFTIVHNEPFNMELLGVFYTLDLS